MTTIEPITDKMSSLAFWALPPAERLEYFRWLRENDPVSWHGPPDSIDPSIPNAQGFWSVVRHADIQYVSRNPQLFTSTEGVFVDDFPQLEQMLSFIVTDAPRHGQMRGIVSAAFTPRHTRKMEEDLHRIVDEVIDEVAPLGSGDLCELVTKVVPGRVFATYFGITDPEQIQFVMDAAEQFGAWADPEYAHIGTPLQVFADASAKLQGVALELAKQRRANPTEDLMSWVAQAQYEGQKMTVEEVGVFFALLAGAANDTTRHGMAHALLLMQRHPDQLAWLMEDFEARWESAVNECLRYEPPLLHFRRNATEDTELGGKLIHKGEKVVLWYVSGCRDAEAFDNPDVFDITRPVKQNPHQAFGGGGPHYCIGHMIGKSMMRAEMKAIYTRMQNLSLGEPTLMLSNFMNGVMKLPGTWTPA